MINGNEIDKAAEELREWEHETGRRLSGAALDIATLETMCGGVAIDLETGALAAMATDGVQTLDDATWLAALEDATGGNVRVAWAIQPDEYFAMVERGEL